ncbi:co-chaperone protein daf-41 isoform X1 [Neodiprion pinetum]|uniref:co-chaperone protein daf-41 isoform X1 n=1 Tax=Neodiprion pinetum TaxID=441929 RepID=UPI001EDEDDA9|nr:co-chaperone protein daf-41 isoform X1 [Neodiprion pinetum]
MNTPRRLNIENISRVSCAARYVSLARLFLFAEKSSYKMTQEGQVTPPPVMWAQRSNVVYVTICLEDCKDPTIKVEPDKIYFYGIGGTERKAHEVTINLYKEIDPEKTIQTPKGRNFELVLTKKTLGPYWPHLTKDKQKYHWLKSDFNKWQDEDDSEDEASFGGGGGGNRDLEEMMRQMGGLGGSGDRKPSFDDLDDMGDDADGPDSDDDDMPDLE